MISRGRFGYHLADIKEAENDSASPHNMQLKQMKAEVMEFEANNPDEAKEIRERFETKGY